MILYNTGEDWPPIFGRYHIAMNNGQSIKTRSKGDGRNAVRVNAVNVWGRRIRFRTFTL